MQVCVLWIALSFAFYEDNVAACFQAKKNYSEVSVIGCKGSYNQLHQIKNVFSRFENLKCEWI